MLDETEIPAHLLDRSRRWFDAQMSRLEKHHGEHWEGVREWLVSYLNAEVREHIQNHEQ